MFRLACTVALISVVLLSYDWSQMKGEYQKGFLPHVQRLTGFYFGHNREIMTLAIFKTLHCNEMFSSQEKAKVVQFCRLTSSVTFSQIRFQTEHNKDAPSSRYSLRRVGILGFGF